MVARILDGLRRHLSQPIAGASLVAFRVLFGGLMAANAVRYEAAGWVHDLYLAPTVRFPFWDLSWAQPLDAPFMHAIFVLIALSALGIAAGAFYRVSVATFFTLFTYVELLDRTTYLNHYYLVSLIAVLLFFMPLGAVASVDAWRTQRRKTSPIEMPRWSLWVLRSQLLVVYFYAGVAKIRGDWLLHGEPLRTWLRRYTDLPLIGGLMDEPSLAIAMSWAGMIFDLSVGFLLLSKRTRGFAYLAVVAFHLTTGSLFYIGIFPFLMIAATTLFLEPDWPKRFVPKRFAQKTGVEPGTPRSPRTRAALGRLGLLALGAYFAVQVALPMRQHFYPGNNCWHERGFRFAWNVMVMEKTGHIDYRVVEERSGRVVHVNPRHDLSMCQLRMMQTQPDLMASYARHLEADFSARGRGPVRVYADAFVSLNGRPHQRYLDPEVDLTALPSSSEAWRAVLPLRTQ